MLLLLGCAEAPEPPPPDLEELLHALADAHTGELFWGFQDTVEEQTGSRWDMEEGETRRGSLDLPADDPSAWPDDATLESAWELGFHQSDSGLSRFTWTITVGSHVLPLEDVRVAGEGVWTVEDVRWGFMGYTAHTWSGRLLLAGPDAVLVEWEAYYAWELRWVEGSVDGVAARWERDPDAR